MEAESQARPRSSDVPQWRHVPRFLDSWADGRPWQVYMGKSANGNSYVGTMRNGLMSGKGVLTWNAGDSFQGNWLDGMMHGYGLYTWEDSGYYLGTWTRGFKDGNGTFYPKHCRVPTAHMLYIDDLRKRGVLPDISTILQQSSSFDTEASADQESVGASLYSRNLSFGQPPSKKPSLQRRWSIGVAIEKIIGRESSAGCETQGCEDMAGSDFPILERVYAQGVLISEVVLNKSSSDSSKKLKRRQSKMAKDIKRPGEAIIKGHRGYDLMLCLQLGIRYTVGKITPIQRREVRTSDYGPNASFWMNFPKKGSRLTPAHRAVDFKWKDYCPMVFRNLREMFKIDTADYMISICGSDALRELSSPGKSGSIFLLSQDDRFMIKTLRKSEVQFRFVVMGNMFYTALRIHRRFDLKGDKFARAEKEEKQEDGDKSFRRVYDVVLYIGIIDILQEYSMRKRIEHAYKSIKYNPLSISVVEPRFYSERFLKFIHTVFPQNSSD
ncbi:hypothetical protein ACQ4PT_070918 [Festuca glaucescens]